MMYVLRKIRSLQITEFARSFDILRRLRSIADIRLPSDRGTHLLYALAISLSILGIYSGAQSSTATSRALEAVALPAASIGASIKPKNLEVHIAGNGLTTLRGSRITSISKGEMKVISAWGSAEFLWKVDLSSKTRFIAGNGEKTSVESLKKGDYVTVTGLLEDDAGTPTIDAQFVRLSR